LTAKLPAELEGHVVPAAVASGLPVTSLPALFSALAADTPAAILAVPGITTSVIQAVMDASAVGQAAAYSYIYYAAVAFAGIALVCALILRPMDHLLTSHVPKRVVAQGFVRKHPTPLK
jgi:Fungal trichothecene efflux pump (TRI12)